MDCILTSLLEVNISVTRIGTLCLFVKCEETIYNIGSQGRNSVISNLLQWLQHKNKITVKTKLCV